MFGIMHSRDESRTVSPLRVRLVHGQRRLSGYMGMRSGTVATQGMQGTAETGAAEDAAPQVGDDLGSRGVYRSRVKVDGCPAYYALDRTGNLVGRGLRVAWPGESAAVIVAELRRELREADPIRPTHLRLIRPDPDTAAPPLTLADALDQLDGPAFARWLYA